MDHKRLVLLHFVMSMYRWLSDWKTRQAPVLTITVIDLLIHARIEALLADIRALLDNYVFSFLEFDREQLLKWLPELRETIEGVLELPDWHFATKKAAFLCEASGLLSCAVKVIDVQARRYDLQQNILRSRLERLHRASRPSVSQDKNSWSQFASPGAPAVSRGRAEIIPDTLPAPLRQPPGTTLQAKTVIALPPAAVSILDDWAEEFHKLYRYLHEVSFLHYSKPRLSHTSSQVHPDNASFQGVSLSRGTFEMTIAHPSQTIGERIMNREPTSKDISGILVEHVRGVSRHHSWLCTSLTLI